MKPVPTIISFEDWLAQNPDLMQGQAYLESGGKVFAAQDLYHQQVVKDLRRWLEIFEQTIGMKI